MSRISFRRGRVAAAVAITSGLVVGGLGIVNAQKGSQVNPPATMKFADKNVGPSRSGFAPVVKAVVPTVVSIKSSKVVKTQFRRGQGQSQIPDQLRDFFGDQFGGQFGGPSIPDEQRSEGLGSGVIVSPEGYILTNNHVVDGATSVDVVLSDRREFKARVIGRDDKTDVAVVKIDAGNLPAITIGDSDRVEVGDYALAIGNPFGVGQSVTLGIVSATRRGNLGIEGYEDFIQTDAAINPGNSGGALVNDRGELVGINTAIIARGSSGNQGIGFAVPINLARNVMDQIMKNGKVTRARLGILPQDVTPTIARQFGVKDSQQGALIGEVEAGSPASKAGLKNGDIILEVDGHSVYDANQLRNMISSKQPDSKVNLKIWRDGAQQTVPVTLGEMNPEQASNRDGNDRNDGSDSALAGVTVEALTSQTARQLNLPPGATGVVVSEVSPSSDAARAGVKRGDVIQEVNRKPVTNVAEFEAAVRNSKDGTLLLVNREGHTTYIGV